MSKVALRLCFVNENVTVVQVTKFLKIRRSRPVHGSKKLDCQADLYTVSSCCTRGESEDHTCKKAHKKPMKFRADVTRRPKQGHQWPHKKDLMQLCPPKFFK